LHLDVFIDMEFGTEVVESLFPGVLNISEAVAFSAADFPVCTRSKGPSVARIVVDRPTLNRSPAANIFLECDFGDDVGLSVLGVTVATD
jgi:hypothetical protein